MLDRTAFWGDSVRQIVRARGIEMPPMEPPRDGMLADALGIRQLDRQAARDPASVCKEALSRLGQVEEAMRSGLSRRVQLLATRRLCPGPVAAADAPLDLRVPHGRGDHPGSPVEVRSPPNHPLPSISRSGAGCADLLSSRTQILAGVEIPSFARPGRKNPHIAAFRLRSGDPTQLEAALVKVPDGRKLHSACFYKDGAAALVVAGPGSGTEAEGTAVLSIADLPAASWCPLALDAFSSALEVMVVQGPGASELSDLTPRERDLEAASLSARLAVSGTRGLGFVATAASRVIVFDLESDE